MWRTSRPRAVVVFEHVVNRAHAVVAVDAKIDVADAACVSAERLERRAQRGDAVGGSRGAGARDDVRYLIALDVVGRVGIAALPKVGIHRQM
jgi:hypothetical protein